MEFYKGIYNKVQKKYQLIEGGSTSWLLSGKQYPNLQAIM